MKLGFLGFGEAAFHMAESLKEEGLVESIAAYDRALGSAEGNFARVNFLRRAETANVTMFGGPSELASAVDMVVLAVPASFAETAAASIIDAMSPAQTLVDVCSSSPGVKEQIAQECAARGLRYVDSAMLGSLPLYRHKVPIVASGDGASDWVAAMRLFGMMIEVIDGPAGKASRIKLSRSIFTKGFEALLVETFQFARKSGVEDVLLRSISDSMDRVSFQQSALRYMSGNLIHADRRAHELKDAIGIMTGSGVEPLVTHGALERLKNSAELGLAERLGGEMPDSLSEVFALWQEAGAI